MNHLYAGLGAFEDTLRLDAARLGAHSRHAASPIDLRITRGVGSRGYGMTRVSVLSFGASAASAIDLRSIDARAYNATMKFRWTSSFDLGVVKTSCGAANVYNRTLNLGMGYDADCLNACSADDRCMHYTYFPSEKACEFAADTCEYVAAPLAEATYKTPGRTVYSSAIVNASTNTTFVIGGTAVSLRLPAFGAGARGVVISDPCFSGRWVGCAFGTTWATYNRTISMLNALAAKGDVDYFAFLGDDFYDQDGRLTTALWRHLSLSFKSTLLLTMPGNHDTWVAGGPPGDQYDQYGWGLNQFYGQDVVSAVALETAGNSTSPRVPLDFSSGGPDKLQHYDAMNNFANNSIFYHIIGNQGFIGFSGAASVDAQRVYFEEACAYMGTADKSLAVVMLLGHWNDVSSGCIAGADVPEVHTLLQGLPGCSGLGKRLKYMDGHTHCNHAGGTSNDTEDEATGFMIGGHGMSGCSQYGFSVVDTRTSSNKTKVLYYEERTETADNFDKILQCVEEHGVSGCEDLAHVWL